MKVSSRKTVGEGPFAAPLWFVYDPDATLLYGPFVTKTDAAEFANLIHPDDMSGNTVVLTLTDPQ